MNRDVAGFFDQVGLNIAGLQVLDVIQGRLFGVFSGVHVLIRPQFPLVIADVLTGGDDVVNRQGFDLVI